MGTENKTKINRLINQWTTGAPSATSYLVASGFSRDLLVKYKNSGWLEPFGRGAYIRSGDKVDWPGALFTLQTQLGLPVHAGGKTALERKGYAHYLPARQKRVFLYGPRGLALPAWFKGDRFGVEFVVTRTNLFPRGKPGGIFRIQGEGLFRTDIGAGTGDAGDASLGAPESRVRRGPVGHGKPRHAEAGSRSGIAGGMPLGQGEKALSLHGRKPGTRLALEGGFVESRSRKGKTDDRLEWPV